VAGTAAAHSGSDGHDQNERAEHAGPALSQDDLDFDFNHARSRAALDLQALSRPTADPTTTFPTPARS
jgi:hypothetical protein